jgi:hypothetical protein
MVMTRAKPYVYRDTSSAAVHIDEQRAASIALSHARHLLGLGDISIQWFQPARMRMGRIWWDNRRLRGLTYPDDPRQIFIRSGQGVRGVVESVLHECRHLWQNREWGASDGAHSKTQREDDADQFAAQHVVKLTLQVPITTDVRSTR